MSINRDLKTSMEGDITTSAGNWFQIRIVVGIRHTGAVISCQESRRLHRRTDFNGAECPAVCEDMLLSHAWHPSTSPARGQRHLAYACPFAGPRKIGLL